MKITICGSIKFAPQLVEIYQKLQVLGHQPLMHKQMFGLADGTAVQLKDKQKDHLETAQIKKNMISFLILFLKKFLMLMKLKLWSILL